MKKLLLVAFCFCLAMAALAQTTPQTVTVKGVVIDSVANKPLGYVTVALQDAKTQQSVKAGLTRDNGSFELKAAAGNAYQLVLVSIGYKNKIIKISGTGPDIDAGRILLSASSSQLD